MKSLFFSVSAQPFFRFDDGLRGELWTDMGFDLCQSLDSGFSCYPGVFLRDVHRGRKALERTDSAMPKTVANFLDGV